MSLNQKQFPTYQALLTWRQASGFAGGQDSNLAGTVATSFRNSLI
jgi:hypothetical protein